MPHQSHYIMSVNDDEEDILLLDQALRECQFESRRSFSAPASQIELYMAGNGAELLSVLNGWQQNQHSPPDLILLDLNMPVMDGITTLRNLKSNLRYRSIPVVVFTTSSSQHEINRCYEIGANAFITKPDNFQELVRVICLIVEVWCFTGKRAEWGPHRAI